MNSLGTFTREQAAKYLNVSLPILDGFLHRCANPLPALRAGRKYLIPRDGLDAWLADEANRQMGGTHND